MEEHKTIIATYDAEGNVFEQDVSRHFHLEDSNLNADDGDGTMVYLSIPYALNYLYTLRGKQEVWVGWRNEGTWIQDATHPLYSGIINSRDVEGQAQSGAEGEVGYRLNLVDYTHLLDTTNVRGYPYDPVYINFGAPHLVFREYHIPVVLPGDPVIDGFPPGNSAAEWLVGITPFNGLVKRFLPDVAIGAIDPIFNEILFEQDTRPRSTSVLGQMERHSLRECVDLVCDMARLVNDSVRPHYSLMPKASGNRIIPEFSLRDLNRPQATDWNLRDHPNALNEWGYFNYNEKWDASSLADVVEVFGIGSDVSHVDEATQEELYRRVYARNATNLGLYPTRWQVVPGWQLMIVNSQVTNNPAAELLAKMVQTALRDEQLTITLDTYAPVRKGQIVDLICQATDTRGIFPVTSVNSTGIKNLFHVTLGEEHLSVQDILSKPSLELLLAGVKRAPRGSGFNFINPNFAPGSQFTGNPTSTQQNSIIAQDDYAANMRIATSIARSHVTQDGMPVGDHDYNFSAENIATPPRRPSPGVTPMPQPMLPSTDEHGDLANWFDVTGFDHPYHYGYSDVTFDDTFTLPHPPVLVFISTLIVETELAGTDFVFPPGSGVSLSLKIRKGDGTVTTETNITSATPCTIYPDDKVALIVQGTNGTSKYGILCSEANPHRLLFKIVRPVAEP
jgi:hypothetical protein